MDSKKVNLRPLIVTIDGPAGAGKSTASRMLARRLGYRYIDTGALYRGIAVAVQDAGIGAADDAALTSLCADIVLDLQSRGDHSRLLLNKRDVTDRLRSPEITMLASEVSARPVVRDFLLAFQRTLGGAKKTVLEGRDMGTVVFPDADVKFFLQADAGIRAQRRYEELRAKRGQGPSLATVEKDMLTRDGNDRARSVAPLKPAPDAIIIDSTSMSLAEVIAAMLPHIFARQADPA